MRSTGPWLSGLADRFERDRSWRTGIVAIGLLILAAYLGPRASSTMVFGLYAVLVGAALLRWPLLGVPGLVMAASTVPFERGGVNVAMLGVSGLTGLWVFERLIDRGDGLGLRRTGVNWAWLALVSAIGLSLVASRAFWNPLVDPGQGFLVVQMAQWSLFALSALAFLLVANAHPDRRLLHVLVVMVLLIGGAFTLLMYWRGPAVAGSWILTGRSLLRVWFVALATAMGLFHRRLSPAVRGGLIVLALAHVGIARWLQPAWQAGWLPSLVALLCVFSLFLGRNNFKVTLITVVGGLVTMAAITLPRLLTVDRWSLDTRLLAWRGLLEIMEGRWLLGLGPAAYWHYWRGVLGSFSYMDPQTGYLHFTFDPQVNMHNNFVDVFGQSGLVGTAALCWLLAALAWMLRRAYMEETESFGRAYVAACAGGFVGMLVAAMLADWILPFVYNVGLAGFRESMISWMLLGGVPLLSATRAARKSGEGGSEG